MVEPKQRRASQTENEKRKEQADGCPEEPKEWTDERRKEEQPEQ